MIIIKQDEVMKLDKEDLIQITGSLMQGGTLDDDLVISMLLSMLPNPPGRAKNAQKWLANAVGVKVNDPRPTLKVLWVNSGNMYASDGHRMHRISTDLADGCYDPKTLEPINDSELKPYNFSKIFDGFNHVKSKLFLPKDMVRVIYNNGSSDGGKSIGFVHEEQQFLVNEKYFIQAVNNNFKQTLSLSVDKKQIYGQSEYGDFVLMLCRYDINEFVRAKEQKQ